MLNSCRKDVNPVDYANVLKELYLDLNIGPALKYRLDNPLVKLVGVAILLILVDSASSAAVKSVRI